MVLRLSLPPLSALRRIWPALAWALLAAICCTGAWAHGVPKPRHGGMVDIGGEISFELVRKGRSVEIYIEDHGKPVATAGATGELLLDSETGRAIAALKAAGANSVAGPAPALKPGQRLFVRVRLGDGSIVVGEFLVR